MGLIQSRFLAVSAVFLFSSTALIAAPRLGLVSTTVVVAIGGAVPSSLDVYVAPGAARDVTFATNSQLGGVIRTNDGGQWLSLAVDGTGSFRFTFPYRVHFAPASNMLPGTYSGTLTTSGSKFAADNKAIPVTMRVTTQPIAQPSTDRLRIRLAQGALPLSTGVALSNAGQGTLIVQSATATSTGGTWLAATSNATGAALNFDSIYAIGLGPTSPSGITGQPAPATPPFAPLTSAATVNFGGGIGGALVLPFYAGLAPNFAGLYQVNVIVPDGLPKGVVNLKLAFSDSVSNSVQIYVQ